MPRISITDSILYHVPTIKGMPASCILAVWQDGGDDGDMDQELGVRCDGDRRIDRQRIPAKGGR